MSQSTQLPYLGFIFHVGLYSYFGYDDVESARRRKIGNGSEWYIARLQEQSYRPISGSTETKIYHKRFGENYDYFRAPFAITRQSIQEWLDLCVRCRASYVIITARHHDGFCLWNTATTNNKSTNDIILIFQDEARKRNLLFGIYYSWFDFLTPFTVEYYNKVCIPQIKELLSYRPDMFWFDGDWKITQKSVKEDIAKIIYYMRTLPFYRPIYTDGNIVNYTSVNGIIVNDRICKENSTLASYHVYEDRFIPNQYMNNWQHINTIGLSWGYNREQKPQDYKSGRDLFNLLCNVTSLGGFTLLNMGPQYDGTLDPNEVQSLNEFSTLIKTL